MNAVKALCIAPLFLAQLAVAAEAAEPSLTGLSEQEPQVQAFYDQQCNAYADASRLSGEKRDAYLAQCLKDAPHVWPVGPDHSE